MKKLCSLFMAIHAATCLWAYDFEAGGLFYNVISDTIPYTAEVTNHPGFPYEIASATIPEKVNYCDITYVVKRIGAGAFKDCYALTSVTIPNSITSIESNDEP